LINAKTILENVRINKNDFNIFDEIEERNKSLFVTLTYPYEIEKNDYLMINKDLKLNFFDEVVFVAIKNGMHDSKGYVFYSPNKNFKNPQKSVHISRLQEMIISFF
jgi:hypothetical protein